MERGLSSDHPDVGRVLYALGKITMLNGNLIEAEAHFRRTCRILENAYGPNDPQLFPSLASRGMALWLLGRSDEAERVLQRVTSLAEQTDGLESPRMAVVVEASPKSFG